MTRPTFADTCCGRLRERMADGAWHLASELEPIGGRRFPARLAEIARGEDGEPMAYDCRTLDSHEGVTMYRMRQYLEGEALPVPRRQRVEELANEVIALRAQVERLQRSATRALRSVQRAIAMGRVV